MAMGQGELRGGRAYLTGYAQDVPDSSCLWPEEDGPSPALRPDPAAELRVGAPPEGGQQLPVPAGPGGVAALLVQARQRLVHRAQPEGVGVDSVDEPVGEIPLVDGDCRVGL